MLIANHGPSQRWLRYPLLQNVDSGCLIGTNIIATAARGENLNSPQNVSKRALKGARISGLVGTVVGASSSGIELGANGVWALRNKVQKNDPGTAKNTLMQQLKELDASLQRLDKRLAQCKPGPVTELLSTECKLLKIYRDWNVYEFAQFYADIKSRQSSNNVFYALNIFSNSAEATAFLLLIKGLKNPRLCAPASICSLTDDGTSIINAPLRGVVCNLLYKIYFKKLSTELNEKLYDPRPLAAELCQKLQQQVAAADSETLALIGPIDKRLVTYTTYNGKYEDYYHQTIAELRRLRQIALQSNLYGVTISTVGLAGDIQGAVSTYSCRRSDRAANAVSFSGSVTGITSNSASFWLTTQWLIRDAFYTSRLKRDHKLPEDILMDRLKTLDIVKPVLELPR